MEVLKLLEYIEDLVEKGFKVPLAGKSMVDKDEVLELIRQVRIQLPDEVKQAQWIKEERQRILIEAQKEAETIIKETENHIKDMVNDNEVTKMAQNQAKEIVANAQKNAKDIRIGSKEYADDLLQEVELKLASAIDEIRKNREELRKTK